MDIARNNRSSQANPFIES